jgi:hypothetical protein
MNAGAGFFAGRREVRRLRQIRERRKIIEWIGKIVERIGEQRWLVLVKRIGKVWRVGEIKWVRQRRQVRVHRERVVKGVGQGRQIVHVERIVKRVWRIIRKIEGIW